MPPSRSCRRACCSSMRFTMLLSFSFVFDEVAIFGEFADQRIHLAQTQWHLRVAFEVAAHEAILTGAHFERSSAGFVNAGSPVFLGQRQHAQNSAHRGLALLTVHAAAECADLLAGLIGAAQQLLCAQRSVLGSILLLNAMTAARLAQVLTQ